MLKNPYGKNWEVSSFYTIYCVAAHAKNTIYCDIPVCNSLKILRERSHIGSNPITRTIINERDFQKSLSISLLHYIGDNLGTKNSCFWGRFA